ncbi:MAG: polyprenyl diphosphate synthase [Oscillospiraceae bacterium]|nr:polyprenyl diphosphate synthase [Oscillospiraceae bacterium]
MRDYLSRQIKKFGRVKFLQKRSASDFSESSAANGPSAEEIDFTNLPRHIAVIMDGNGRWAKRISMPRAAGHAAGAETFRTVANYCKKIGIDYLTVYAFSTENSKRPPEEVAEIMRLLDKYLREALEKMEKDQTRMKFFGDTDALSAELRELITKTNKLSAEIKGFQVNMCVNYGGRDELVRAAKRYAEDVKNGLPNELSENAFSDYMYSEGIPDPDLIIRPGGELRMSNFLLWQLAYSELYFTEKLWPDFDEREIDRAVIEYQKRSRRFGEVK